MILRALLLSCFALLISCKQYAVSLNDNVIYTPLPLFTGFRVADARLQTCLDQTILDLKATRIEEVTHLNCSNAGITSLAGIKIFYALKTVNLANNNIQDINELQYLARTQIIDLSNNAIKNGAPLLHLLHLLELNLAENSQFDCAILPQLTKNLADQKPRLTVPAHCKK